MILAAALAQPAPLRGARSDVDYQSLKQDKSLYSGEGVARLSEHSGDPLAAERAALIAARGALAESIETRISVLTTDILVGGSKAASEHIQSKSRSVSVVELANVRTRTFTDRPKDGEITVLSYITRRDYRSLLGGRLDDSPHGALTIQLGENSLIQGADLAQSMASSSSAPLISMPGFEVAFGPWAIGLAAFNYRIAGGAWDPRQETFTPGGPSIWRGGLTFYRVNAGFDWKIGKARFQPYLPLRLEYQILQVSDVGSASFPGASAGLGLRYWLNNHLALDLRGAWHKAFQEPSAMKSWSGGTLMIFPPQALKVNMDGPELVLGFQVTD